MPNIKRECCNYCMWLGPVNKDNTIRKHRPATSEDRYGRKVQNMTEPVCQGSNKPFATFGAEPEPESEPEPCGSPLYKLSGGKVRCTKPAGHDKAHFAA